MRCMLVLLAPVLLFVVHSASAARADTLSPSDYARVNAALVEDHVVPRYERLSAAALRFTEAVTALCAGGAQDPAPARAEFDALMGSWMGVQHVRFGPVEHFMRSYRFYFWPQARGKARRAVDEAVAEREHAPETGGIDRANVAVQGLIAAEILLYDRPSPGAGTAGCGLLSAVAENMRGMAAGIVAEWKGGERPFAGVMTGPGPENDHFANHQDATLALFRSLYDGLQFTAEIRLRAVVGESLEAARPHSAESRRSGRSLRNVLDSLEALQALYGGEGGPGLGSLAQTADPKLDRLLRKAFRLSLGTASTVATPLEAAAKDPALRPRAEKLVLQVRALTQIVRDRLGLALGLAVGFNALDGD